LATVAWAIWMPSFRSSPWMRGAFQSGLAACIWPMRARRSAATAGRPGRRRRADLKATIGRLDRELGNLAAAAAAGGSVPALVAAIRARQKRRDEAARALGALEEDTTTRTFTAARLKRELSARLAEWRRLVERTPGGARVVLEKALAGRIVFTPRADGTAYDVEVPLALDHVFEASLPIGGTSPEGIAETAETISGLFRRAA
jgi:hypothetical protein